MAASVFCCLRCCRDGGTGHIPLKEMPAVQLDTQHMGKGSPFPRPNGPPRVGAAGRGQPGVTRTARCRAPPGSAPCPSPCDAALDPVWPRGSPPDSGRPHLGPALRSELRSPVSSCLGKMGVWTYPFPQQCPPGCRLLGLV